MSLTTGEMKQIIEDRMADQPPTVLGEEADKFRQELEADIAYAKAHDYVLEIPAEWET